jgi:hypothetical protein
VDGAESAPAQVVALPGVPSGLALARTGAGLVAAWTTGGYDQNGVYAALLGPGLALAAPPVRAFSGTSYTTYSAPVLACRPDGCMLGAATSAELYLARLGAGAALLDYPALPARPVLAARRQLALAAAADGYLAAWNQVSAGARELRAARLSGDGLLLDATPVLLAQDVPSAPALAADGGTLLAVWEAPTAAAGGVLQARRLSWALAPLDPTPLSLGAADALAQRPAAAAGAGQFLVAWEASADLDVDVLAARVPSSGPAAADAGRLLSSGAAAETDPAVAFDGTNFLVVWRDTRDFASRQTGIVGARVTPAGVVLDPSGIVVADGAAAESRPAVAFGPGGYLVVWEDRRAATGPDVYAARVGVDGAVLDPDGVPVAVAAGPQQRPVVAAGPGGWLVAWEESSYPPSISAARLGADARPVGAPLALAPAGGCGDGCGAVALAGGPGGWFVAWERASLGAGAQGVEIRGAVVDPAAAPVALTVAGGVGVRGTPAVDFDGARFLVAWVELGGAGAAIRGARVSPTGALLDPAGVAIVDGPGRRAAPRLAFDGERHLLAFDDLDAGALRGAALTPAGGVAEAFAISTAALPGAAIACDGAGGCLAVYARDDLAVGARRLALRTLRGPTPGQRCSVDGECATAHCVDGVCCDTACGGGAAGDCLACSVAAGAPVDGTCAAVAPGLVCRAAAGPCDAPERCDGAAPACPADAPAPEGAPCDGGDRCTDGDSCHAGACQPGAPRTCAAADACHLAGACDPATGACSSPRAPDGTACPAANACTTGAQCWSGVCSGGASVACPDPGPCRMARCNPATGACATEDFPDGTGCSDGSACTAPDRCQAGSCVSGAPVSCLQPADPCQVARCDPGRGCVTEPAQDGTPCSDGNACTQGDACHAGACVGGAATSCAAADGCHAAGSCDPVTGVCSRPVLPDGTACQDGDACTAGDACRGGTCQPGPPLHCEALDACHLAGSCDPATGACSTPPAPDGTACDDGDACTRSDRCAAGACVGAAPVVCPAPDACHASACAAATGACATTALADGTGCPGGTCREGACLPAGGGGGGGCATGAGGWAALLGVWAAGLLARRRRA